MLSTQYTTSIYDVYLVLCSTDIIVLEAEEIW